MAESFTRLLRIFRGFQRYYSQAFGPLQQRTGLALREVQVLLFLANHPGQDTARDVVELRGLPKSQVSQAVDILCRRGFLSRKADAEDRRVVHLAITDQGALPAREAQRLQALCGQRLLEGLTPQEQREFLRLLETVFENTDALAERSLDREP